MLFTVMTANTQILNFLNRFAFVFSFLLNFEYSYVIL